MLAAFKKMVNELVVDEKLLNICVATGNVTKKLSAIILDISDSTFVETCQKFNDIVSWIYTNYGWSRGIKYKSIARGKMLKTVAFLSLDGYTKWDVSELEKKMGFVANVYGISDFLKKYRQEKLVFLMYNNLYGGETRLETYINFDFLRSEDFKGATAGATVVFLAKYRSDISNFIYVGSKCYDQVTISNNDLETKIKQYI
jgi:hypothetical protein